MRNAFLSLLFLFDDCFYFCKGVFIDGKGRILYKTDEKGKEA